MTQIKEKNWVLALKPLNKFTLIQMIPMNKGPKSNLHHRMEIQTSST